MHALHFTFYFLVFPVSILGALPPRETTSCGALEAALPGKVAYPGTTEYSLSNNYWSSRQSELAPLCFVRPSSAFDVSTVLQILRACQSPFTVKSGGHAAFGTGSSIQHGITIDMSAMNDIVVSADRSTVSVGPGVRWRNVTDVLDPMGLAVVGGRQPDVGVSGLILGGGNSFLSGRRGWACDNVQKFEVVLASGEIINASPTEHRDLFWALRGGGGASFGIVTKFDLDAYEQGDVWVRQTVWPLSETSDVLITFAGIARDALHIDRDAHLFVMLGYFPELEAPFILTSALHLNHTSPPNGIFDTFEGLARLPNQVVNETLVAPLGDVVDRNAEPYGQRKTFWMTTVRDGSGIGTLLNDIVDLWTEYADELRASGQAKDTVVQPVLNLQPITNTTLQAMKRNGGNALGLEPGEFPLFFILLVVSWEDRSLDCLIEQRSQKLITAIDQLAEGQGFGHRFKYLNYAGKTQDVFPTYGTDNHQRLRNVAETYDPEGVLRELWKGYFKVY